MQIYNNSERYGLVHAGLHFIMALLIVSMLCLGYYMNNVTYNPTLYFFHKSFGVVVFMLVIVRLVWKFVNPFPKPDTTIPSLIRALSTLGHFALYAFMIIMPLSGFLYSAFKGYPTNFFGLFTIPAFTPNKETAHLFEEIHEISSFIFSGLILTHSVMALVHHYILKDNTLRKMVPCVKKPS